MELMLRIHCTNCRREFIVLDDQIESDSLTCPHCDEDLEVPQDDDEEDED